MPDRDVRLPQQLVSNVVVGHDFDLKIRCNGTEPVQHRWQEIRSRHFGGRDPNLTFDRLGFPRSRERHQIGTLSHRPDMVEEI